MRSRKVINHWTCLPDYGVDTANDLGMIYCIENKLDGRKYFGRKQYWRKFKRTWIYDPSWEDYSGSSKLLSTDISRCGRESFNYRILASLRSKSGLAVGEASAILCSRALLYPDKYYNRAASSVRGSIKISKIERARIIWMLDWIEANT